MFHNIRKIHFVGIGGTGMSGIAEVLANLGFQVSGSDAADGDTLRRLEQIGCRVAVGHAAEHLRDAQVVVVSTAVSATNPEVVAARAAGVPVIPRAEMLAELMRMKFGVAVAGAHGKTTTTWLASLVMDHGGFDPTIVVGGRLRSLGTNARLGRGRYLVAEADESDGSFLRLNPTLAVITNVDREHLDHYGTLEKIRSTFIEFANRVPFYGAVILCVDDPLARGLLPDLHRRVITYGFAEGAEVRALRRRREGGRTKFVVARGGKELGEISLGVPGEHMVRNSLAAVCVGLEVGVPFDAIRTALGEFSGIARRMEVRAEVDDVVIVDDYGHHPTEIAATLSAAREWQPDHRIVAIFQPHRYTRTRDLAAEFGPSLTAADRVVVTSIYAAGEDPLPGVTAALVADAARDCGAMVSLVEDWEDAVELLLPEIKPGDVVLTLGAGDVWKAGDLLAARLAASSAVKGKQQGSPA